MADLHLWLDGKEEDELSCGWQTDLQFSFDRFQSDDRYAHHISNYIQQALDNLAKEIEEIGVVKEADNRYPECERAV